MSNENVRLGIPADADVIYNFLLNLHDENSIFSISEDRARRTIEEILTPQFGCIGIIENNGVIEGCIGLRVAQLWYTSEWFLDELWNYVHPDFRKTGHGSDLIDFAKKKSTEVGLPLLMGIVTRKSLAPKARLYQRKLSQIGAWFVYGRKFDDMYQQRKAITKKMRHSTEEYIL